MTTMLNERLLPVLEHLNPATAYIGHYNHFLVGISLVIAVLAAYVALSISGRIVAAKTQSARWAWTSAGAVSMGGGIWSMHFIGMLAFSLPCGITYSPVNTLLSMIPGIIASGVALRTVSAPSSPSSAKLFISAVLLGAGIGAMHYAGMAAMRPEALLRYDAHIVAVSVIVAVTLALIALRIHSRRTSDSNVLQTFVAATIMGSAMAGMHYTAMEASTFFPMPDTDFQISALPPGLLAAAVTIIAILLTTITLVATFAGRQRELAANLRTEAASRWHVEQDLIRARELAEAASIAKSAFLASMSHEIRTPLNGVIGNLELLALTSPNTEQFQLIDQADNAAKALLALIGNILDFSKIEQGKLAIEMGEMNTAELIEDAVAILQTKARQKNIFITAITDQELPEIVWSDAMRVRQILLNLIGNAVKFTETGSISVRVVVSHRDGDRCELKFVVHDSGRGFDQSRAGRLFEAFVQDKVSVDTSEGTGLGLSICQKLVEALDGSIGCESATGEGATFWFKLPVSIIKPVSYSQPANLSNCKIAFVGGDMPGVQSLRNYFDVRHATVLQAKSLTEAVAILEPASADILTTRVVLVPAAESFPEEIHDLRKRNIVPLMYGGDGSYLTKRRALRAGFVGVLWTSEGPSYLDRNIHTLFGGISAQIPANPHPMAERVPNLTVGDKHILVLEDRLVNQLVIQKQLDKLGVRFTIAGDGLLGLAALEQQDFDLILCDCSMPNMNGYDFTRTVRAKEKMARTARHVPIIALTANAFREDVEKCRGAGMDDFISKPVNLDRLGEVLSKWLTPNQHSVTPVSTDTHADEAPIDMAILEEILGEYNEELANEILVEFVAAAKQSLTSLQAALANGRLNGIQVTAHGAKGEARSAGAIQLGDLYAELEKQAKAGKSRGFDGLAIRIAEEINHIEVFVDSRTGTASAVTESVIAA